MAAYFTALLLRRCMDSYPDISSYSDMAGRAFGVKGRVIAALFISLELYLVAIGLLILEEDNLYKLSPNFALRLGNLIIEGRHSFLILSGLLIWPSMLLSDLGVVICFSWWCYIFLGRCSLCFMCWCDWKQEFNRKRRFINFQGIPTALSLYSFCYGAHAVFPAIYTSMRKKKQFSRVLLISFVICTINYLSMAIIGYLMYGQNVESQVTLNLPVHEACSKIAIYTILAGPIAKYPLTITPVANVIESWLPPNYQKNKPIGVVIRSSLLISTVILALVFPSFESVTSLSGAFLVVSVSFLLPCVCYLKIFEVYRNWGIELVVIMISILRAVLVGAVGTYSSIISDVKHTN